MASTEQSRVQTGLSRVVAEPALLPTRPTGFCTNYTSVDDELRRGVDVLVEAGVDLRCLFTPEHGYWGAVQAGEDVGDDVDPSGLPVIDTYTVSGEPLDALLRGAGVEQVIIDLQDIGARFYTYVWTVYDLLCSAARTGVAMIILDRPNPLGGTVRAGPGLEPACASFIGRVSIPLQHGLSLGELARWFNTSHVPESTGRAADLTVVPASGWDRSRRTGTPWVMPSPNMPTLDTATAYPATCLFEGTILSEGRGTTRPFELFGAPWLDPRHTDALRERGLPGVLFREAVFTPTFSKGAGELHRGSQLQVVDPDRFDPIATGFALLDTLRDLHPEVNLWRPAESGRPPFVDLLWGSPALREGLDAREDLATILARSPSAPEVPQGVEIYPVGPG